MSKEIPSEQKQGEKETSAIQSIVVPVSCDLYSFYRIKIQMIMAIIYPEFRIINKVLDFLAWSSAFAFCVKRNPGHDELYQFLLRNEIVSSPKEYRNTKYTLKKKKWITTEDEKGKRNPSIVIKNSVFDLENAMKNKDPKMFSMELTQDDCACDSATPKSFKMNLEFNSSEGIFAQGDIKKGEEIV